MPQVNEGSTGLHRLVAGEVGEALRGVPLPEDQVERRRRTAREGGFVPLRPDRPPWMPEHLALLGVLPDDEVAARTGRTECAVRTQRQVRHIPTARPRRHPPAPRPPAPPWTAEELTLLRKVPDKEVAARTGRTLSATQQKRLALKIPPAGRRKRR